MAERGATIVFLSVSANLEPEKNIEAALAQLSAQLPLDGISTFYRTAAIDRPSQPDYLNGVVSIRTTMGPWDLKSTVLRPIEARQGRVRSADAYAAREIDLDILLHGAHILSDGELTLPDPDIIERPFLSAGLLELDPQLVLPGDSRPLAQRVDSDALSSLTEDSAFTQRIKELHTQ